MQCGVRLGPKHVHRPRDRAPANRTQAQRRSARHTASEVAALEENGAHGPVHADHTKLLRVVRTNVVRLRIRQRALQ